MAKNKDIKKIENFISDHSCANKPLPMETCTELHTLFQKDQSDTAFKLALKDQKDSQAMGILLWASNVYQGLVINNSQENPLSLEIGQRTRLALISILSKELHHDTELKLYYISFYLDGLSSTANDTKDFLPRVLPKVFEAFQNWMCGNEKRAHLIFMAKKLVIRMKEMLKQV